MGGFWQRLTRVFPIVARNGLTWIIWRQRNDLDFNAMQWLLKKTYQVVWDSLIDYGKIEWQQTLSDLENAADVAYQNVLREFDSVWCVKSLSIQFVPNIFFKKKED